MNEEIKITCLDQVHCSLSGRDYKVVKPSLCYKAVFYKQKQFGRERITYDKSVAIKDKTTGEWLFPSGLLGRVMRYCERNKISVELDGDDIMGRIESAGAHLKGIKFRPDQIEVIKKLTGASPQRGVILAPTGSGKTLVGLGILSCFPSRKALWLCHTLDLMNQTFEEATKFGFKASKLGGGNNDFGGDLKIATRQTFSKMLEHGETIKGFYDELAEIEIVVVDEAHHVTTFDGQYANILSNLLAPIRLGLTATMPDRPDSRMALEAFVGPKIGEVSIQQGMEEGFLAQPKIQLLRSKKDQRIKQLNRYPEVYRRGIVENRHRNKMIMSKVGKFLMEGKSVLILVTQIEHGTQLQYIGQDIGIQTRFVQGATESEARKKIKKTLESKKTKCVISTTVWREGINIPSLDVVVNAAGGKSEIMTLQAIGRGLRTTTDKKEVIIVDVFDPSHHYLVNHFGERITLYMKNGWL